MQSLKDCLKEASEKKVAIGHFNISNLDGLWAVFKAAKSLNLPIIIGTSEKEREFIGLRQAVALVRSLREEFNYPIYLNADHTYSFEKVKEAIDAGFDAVIFDGTEKSLEENIKITRECVQYAKSKNPDVVVEGELGYKGVSSQLLEKIPQGVELTRPDEAARFVKETGVDLLAPAVGNFHGMLKGGDPALNIERVSEIYQAAGVPLVLHGASGNSAEDIKAAIAAGMVIVHISTELRVAYRAALEESLKTNPKELAAYKLLAAPVAAVERVAMEKLKIFNNL